MASIEQHPAGHGSKGRANPPLCEAADVSVGGLLATYVYVFNSITTIVMRGAARTGHLWQVPHTLSAKAAPGSVRSATVDRNEERCVRGYERRSVSIGMGYRGGRSRSRRVVFEALRFIARTAARPAAAARPRPTTGLRLMKRPAPVAPRLNWDSAAFA